MKKNITNLVLLLILPLTILYSCSKSELKDQTPAISSESTNVDDDDAGRNYNNCCCNCPSSVATATSISYMTLFWDPLQVHIPVDVFYTNHGPQGTLRIVLRTADGNIDSVAIVPAPHTNAGDSAMLHLEYTAGYNDFPCKLHVNGRPSNLDCGIRSPKIFDITYSVSRN